MAGYIFKKKSLFRSQLKKALKIGGKVKKSFLKINLKPAFSSAKIILLIINM